MSLAVVGLLAAPRFLIIPSLNWHQNLGKENQRWMLSATPLCPSCTLQIHWTDQPQSTSYRRNDSQMIFVICPPLTLCGHRMWGVCGGWRLMSLLFFQAGLPFRSLVSGSLKIVTTWSALLSQDVRSDLGSLVFIFFLGHHSSSFASGFRSTLRMSPSLFSPTASASALTDFRRLWLPDQYSVLTVVAIGENRRGGLKQSGCAILNYLQNLIGRLYIPWICAHPKATSMIWL